MVSTVNKPIVAHIHDCFFNASETFIYAYLSNHRLFHPICLASRFINNDQFPFPSSDLYNVYVKRFSYRWFLKRIFGIDRQSEDIMRERNVCLMHAHFGPNGVNALNLKRRSRVPLITTFYGYDISSLPRSKRWRLLYRDLFQIGELFLVEGPCMKEKLIKLGCPEMKIQIQRIAISIDSIPFRTRKPKNTNERIILIFSGRFVEKKGIIYTLEAIKQLRDAYTNFELRIIGDGPLRNQITKFIERNKMGNYVKLLGFLPHNKYLSEMQNADIFIHPSVTAKDGDSEGGAPTVILEAQTMGLPIISTYHADIPNIVAQDKSALLSEEKNVAALKQNVARLLENQDIWEKMGIAGREFVQSYHNINNELPILEKRYFNLLKN